MKQIAGKENGNAWGNGERTLCWEGEPVLVCTLTAPALPEGGRGMGAHHPLVPAAGADVDHPVGARALSPCLRRPPDGQGSLQALSAVDGIAGGRRDPGDGGTPQPDI